ncbi:class I SAM-dependent methyltransferase [Thalassospira marina]|nr:class I SAM-dependent methyltransferase [Thalassospira marina]
MMTNLPFAKKMRRWKLGLKTLFGKEPAGYFIPYRYAAQTSRAVGRPHYTALEQQFSRHRADFKSWLLKAELYRDALVGFNRATPPDPRWEQGWFPGMDGMMAYVMTRELRPRRIVEVGSGHSTRFFYRAVLDEGLDTDISAIDPAPRADIALLPITIHQKIVQKVSASVFADLLPGDILSIDSSHILMPGTDVDMLFSTVLPILPSGVIIHIHDICLPNDYPSAWQWRGYNEQQGVAALLAGGGFEIMWSSAYANNFMKDTVTTSIANDLPLLDGSIETSLWLRKK